MRRCPKCKVEKELDPDNFRRDKTKKYGYEYWCKECRKERYPKKDSTIKMNRFGLSRRNGEKEKDFQNRIEKERSKRRQEAYRRYRERNRAKLSQRTIKWQHENPEKVELIRRSGYEVRKAIKKGLLTRPDTCEWCGKKHKNIDAAHHDYSKPLDVKWLCRRCHTKWDKGEPKLKWVKNRHR